MSYKRAPMLGEIRHNSLNDSGVQEALCEWITKLVLQGRTRLSDTELVERLEYFVDFHSRNYIEEEEEGLDGKD